MRIKRHGQQNIGHIAFKFVLLMHQFMGIVDPNSAADHTDGKKDTHLQAKCIITLFHDP